MKGWLSKIRNSLQETHSEHFRASLRRFWRIVFKSFWLSLLSHIWKIIWKSKAEKNNKFLEAEKLSKLNEKFHQKHSKFRANCLKLSRIFSRKISDRFITRNYWLSVFFNSYQNCWKIGEIRQKTFWKISKEAKTYEEMQVENEFCLRDW